MVPIAYSVPGRRPARLVSLSGLLAAFLVLVSALPVIALKQAITFHHSSTYDGAQSYVALDTDPISGGWLAAPVGVTNWTSAGFVEAGPTRDCSKSCSRIHPYSTWETRNENPGKLVHTGFVLCENEKYQYWVVQRDDSTAFRSGWCDGGGCHELASPNVGTTSFSRTAVGIESTDPNPLPVKATTTSNQLSRITWSS